MASELVDELLARYLGLLHDYTELRSQLSARQASMFGHLARANFSAERGFRYGPDHFDGRMQALVRLEVTEDSGSAEKAAAFAITRPTKKVSVEAREEANKDIDDGDEGDSIEQKKKQQDGDKADGTAGEGKKNNTQNKKKDRGSRDPLQWFGVLTPMALRQAQQEAIAAIDCLVPRLATISAEMAAVEITVRRARKKRARADAAQDKEDKSTGTTTKTEESISV
ncbi:hypothetical protein SCUCBS95973_002536 [Sporothrix curviconia]|uniref:Vacuolar ATPase assembly protein VMA22 n=1 Tax=Sporothrix curviconia TaxID=1260050 RepID=A0ABP0B7S4_9PEZI